jgi:hypothetical protein
MELQRGDKLLLPLVEVLNKADKNGDHRVFVEGRMGYMHKFLLGGGRKVLGLLGDEGLKAEVGMKVWDSTFGEGEIVDTENTPAFPIAVEFVSAGRPRACYSRSSERTLYVTERAPKEPLGWAWVRGTVGEPFTAPLKMTESRANKNYGDRLIKWISEEEV